MIDDISAFVYFIVGKTRSISHWNIPFITVYFHVNCTNHSVMDHFWTGMERLALPPAAASPALHREVTVLVWV